MSIILGILVVFFASWVVILKQIQARQNRQLNAVCDAMLLYAKHDYTDSHGFVQSLKQIMNGDF